MAFFILDATFENQVARGADRDVPGLTAGEFDRDRIVGADAVVMDVAAAGFIDQRRPVGFFQVQETAAFDARVAEDEIAPIGHNGLVPVDVVMGDVAGFVDQVFAVIERLRSSVCDAVIVIQ